MLQVKEKDIVEVLPGCKFSSLVYSSGVVEKTLGCRMAVVRFQQDRSFTDPELMEKFTGKLWTIPFKYLKILDSPHDNRLGVLEEEILGLEADLVGARSCIIMSEELRELQEWKIKQLIEEIDLLNREVYLLRGVK